MDSWWGPAQYAGWCENGTCHTASLLARVRSSQRPLPRLVEPVQAPLGSPGGVDADQLQQRADPQPVEQAGVDRRPPGLLPRPEPGAQVEVVLQLLPVVAGLGVRAVVVAGGRVEREVVEEVPVRLEEREPPVLVEGAGGVLRTAGPVVDRVAEADDEPDVDRVGQPLHRAGDRELPRPVGTGGDADAEVAEGEEGHRVRLRAAGVGPQPLVERPPGGAQRPRRPVEALPRAPRLAVDEHPVPVGGRGPQPLAPRRGWPRR